MKIKNLLQKKLNDVKLNHSEGTYNFYRSHLQHFLSWCDNQCLTDVSELSDDTFIDYVYYQRQTAQNATINKRMGIIRRTFEYGCVTSSFLTSYKKLKERHTTFETIEFKTYLKFRNLVSNYLVLKDNDIMYRCLLALLVDTGARINELLNIEIKNIDLSDRSILLTKTKTNLDRVIYLTTDSIDAIKDMIRFNDKSKYLLFNFDKKRQTNYEDARFFMRKLKDKYKLKKLSTHMFRHTIATNLVERGIDLFSVMKILGHLNIKTTERYTHVSKKHVKKAYHDAMKF